MDACSPISDFFALSSDLGCFGFSQVFGGGMLGAFFAEFLNAYKKGNSVTTEWRKLLGIIAIPTALGGVAAFLNLYFVVYSNNFLGPFLTGAGWESFFATLLKGKQPARSSRPSIRSSRSAAALGTPDKVMRGPVPVPSGAVSEMSGANVDVSASLKSPESYWKRVWNYYRE